MSIRSFILCFILYNFIRNCEQCSKEYPFQVHLGTRTPYRTVSNITFDKINYNGCAASKIWMIVRHGTRNPSVSNIEDMKNKLPKIQQLILENENLPNGNIKNRDLDLFRKWKIRLDIDDETKLTHEGEEEMLLLAERMQNRFPDIFNDVYSNTTYKFRYTYSQRTKKSALYFAAGLFGKHTAKEVWFPEPLKRDPILRFYKLCEKWRQEIKANEKETGEYKKFSAGFEMTNVIQNVNKRLGLQDAIDLDDIYLMYITCGFETAWNKQSKSPWCSVFSEEDFKVLEYMDDLRCYWIDGYGHELTYQQACPAFGDMVSHLDISDPYPKATVYFTHSGTLLKMLAHMGLYKDQEALTSTNYDKMTNRKWRTSLIDAFGTNLAFVLFNCNGDKEILTLHQENIVRLPPCPDSDLCDYNKILDYYSHSIKKCDFTAMCNKTDD